MQITERAGRSGGGGGSRLGCTLGGHREKRRRNRKPTAPHNTMVGWESRGGGSALQTREPAKRCGAVATLQDARYGGHKTGRQDGNTCAVPATSYSGLGWVEHIVNIKYCFIVWNLN